MRHMSRLPPYPLTDQQLVGRVLAGEPLAFDELMRRTEGLVAQVVFKMIRHSADRPDIIQDVYLKAFHRLKSFQFQAKLSTWIGQIAYNTCLHYLEKKHLVLVDFAEPAASGYPATSRSAAAPAVETQLAEQDRAAPASRRPQPAPAALPDPD